MKVIGIYFCLAAFCCVSAGYWDWGWGVYGTECAEDTARFDWSLLLLGNVPATEETVKHCRQILEWNPRHKFFIRIWPICGIGANHGNMTLFDYHYGKDVRLNLFAEMEKQLDLFVAGIGRDHVCGISFCEELPSHISEFSEIWQILRNPQAVRAPWKNILSYRDRVLAELGGDFDPAQKDHLQWWCDKYVSMLDGIHRKIKELAPGIPVFYWQRTNFFTEEMTAVPRHDAFPIRLQDILGKERCDGIFVYAGNPVSFEREGMQFVRKYQIPFFSQISTPSRMRGRPFEEVVTLARTENPYNMGAFLYCDTELHSGSEGAIQESRNPRLWTKIHQMRWFGDMQDINKQLVAELLQPEVILTGKQELDGLLNLHVLIFNRKNTLWYPGVPEHAELHCDWQLLLPEKITIEDNLPTFGTLSLREHSARLYEWKMKHFPHASPIKFRLGKRIFDWNGKEIRKTDFQTIRLKRFEPWAPVLKENLQTITLRALSGNLQNPSLQTAGERADFIGGVEVGQKLILHADGRAEIVTENLFSPQAATFGTLSAEAKEISTGYHFFTVPNLPLMSGKKYRLEVHGMAENTKLLVYTSLHCTENGQEVQKTIRPMLSALENGTASSVFEIPGTTGEINSTVFRFYRLQNKGILRLEKMMLVPLENERIAGNWTGRLLKKLKIGDILCFLDENPPPFFAGTPEVEITLH